MNKDEFAGNLRDAGGKVETAVGGPTNKCDWQVGGVVDQIAGAARHSDGRVRAIVGYGVAWRLHGYRG